MLPREVAQTFNFPGQQKQIIIFLHVHSLNSQQERAPEELNDW